MDEHGGQNLWLSLYKVETVVCAVLCCCFFCTLQQYIVQVSYQNILEPTHNFNFSWERIVFILFFFFPPILLSPLPHNLVEQGCFFLPWHNAAWLRNIEPICLCDNMKTWQNYKNRFFFFFFPPCKCVLYSSHLDKYTKLNVNAPQHKVKVRVGSFRHGIIHF